MRIQSLCSLTVGALAFSPLFISLQAQAVVPQTTQQQTQLQQASQQAVTQWLKNNASSFAELKGLLSSNDQQLIANYVALHPQQSETVMAMLNIMSLEKQAAGNSAVNKWLQQYFKQFPAQAKLMQSAQQALSQFAGDNPPAFLAPNPLFANNAKLDCTSAEACLSKYHLSNDAIAAAEGLNVGYGVNQTLIANAKAMVSKAQEGLIQYQKGNLLVDNYVLGKNNRFVPKYHWALSPQAKAVNANLDAMESVVDSVSQQYPLTMTNRIYLLAVQSLNTLPLTSNQQRLAILQLNKLEQANKLTDNNDDVTKINPSLQSSMGALAFLSQFKSEKPPYPKTLAFVKNNPALVGVYLKSLYKMGINPNEDSNFADFERFEADTNDKFVVKNPATGDDYNAMAAARYVSGDAIHQSKWHKFKDVIKGMFSKGNYFGAKTLFAPESSLVKDIVQHHWSHLYSAKGLLSIQASLFTLTSLDVSFANVAEQTGESGVRFGQAVYQGNGAYFRSKQGIEDAVNLGLMIDPSLTEVVGGAEAAEGAAKGVETVAEGLDALDAAGLSEEGLTPEAVDAMTDLTGEFGPITVEPKADASTASTEATPESKLESINTSITKLDAERAGLKQKVASYPDGYIEKLQQGQLELRASLNDLRANVSSLDDSLSQVESVGIDPKLLAKRTIAEQKLEYAVNNLVDAEEALASAPESLRPAKQTQYDAAKSQLDAMNENLADINEDINELSDKLTNKKVASLERQKAQFVDAYLAQSKRLSALETRIGDYYATQEQLLGLTDKLNSLQQAKEALDLQQQGVDIVSISSDSSSENVSISSDESLTSLRAKEAKLQTDFDNQYGESTQRTLEMMRDKLKARLAQYQAENNAYDTRKTLEAISKLDSHLAQIASSKQEIADVAKAIAIKNNDNLKVALTSFVLNISGDISTTGINIYDKFNPTAVTASEKTAITKLYNLSRLSINHAITSGQITAEEKAAFTSGDLLKQLNAYDTVAKSTLDPQSYKVWQAMTSQNRLQVYSAVIKNYLSGKPVDGKTLQPDEKQATNPATQPDASKRAMAVDVIARKLLGPVDYSHYHQLKSVWSVVSAKEKADEKPHTSVFDKALEQHPNAANVMDKAAPTENNMNSQQFRDGGSGEVKSSSAKW